MDHPVHISDTVYVSRTNICIHFGSRRVKKTKTAIGDSISRLWRFRWLILFPYCRRPLLSKYWQNIAYYLRYLEGVTYDDISVFDMCVLIEVIARAICKQRPSYSDQIAQHIIHLSAKKICILKSHNSPPRLNLVSEQQETGIPLWNRNSSWSVQCSVHSRCAPPNMSARLSLDPAPDAPDGLLSLEAATASTASADIPSAAADADRCRFFPATAATFDGEHVVAVGHALGTVTFWFDK